MILINFCHKIRFLLIFSMNLIIYLWPDLMVYFWQQIFVFLIFDNLNKVQWKHVNLDPIYKPSMILTDFQHQTRFLSKFKPNLGSYQSLAANSIFISFWFQTPVLINSSIFVTKLHCDWFFITKVILIFFWHKIKF